MLGRALADEGACLLNALGWRRPTEPKLVNGKLGGRRRTIGAWFGDVRIDTRAGSQTTGGGTRDLPSSVLFVGRKEPDGI